MSPDRHLDQAGEGDSDWQPLSLTERADFLARRLDERNQLRVQALMREQGSGDDSFIRMYVTASPADLVAELDDETWTLVQHGLGILLYPGETSELGRVIEDPLLDLRAASMPDARFQIRNQIGRLRSVAIHLQAQYPEADSTFMLRQNFLLNLLRPFHELNLSPPPALELLLGGDYHEIMDIMLRKGAANVDTAELERLFGQAREHVLENGLHPAVVERFLGDETLAHLQSREAERTWLSERFPMLFAQLSDKYEGDPSAVIARILQTEQSKRANTDLADFTDPERWEALSDTERSALFARRLERRNTERTMTLSDMLGADSEEAFMRLNKYVEIEPDATGIAEVRQGGFERLVDDGFDILFLPSTADNELSYALEDPTLAQRSAEVSDRELDMREAFSRARTQALCLQAAGDKDPLATMSQHFLLNLALRFHRGKAVPLPEILAEMRPETMQRLVDEATAKYPDMDLEGFYSSVLRAQFAFEQKGLEPEEAAARVMESFQLLTTGYERDHAQLQLEYPDMYRRMLAQFGSARNFVGCVLDTDGGRLPDFYGPSPDFSDEGPD